MSKGRPIEAQRLCRKLCLRIRTPQARRELAKACGIRHRQQLDRFFPKSGKLTANSRLTARSALAALRWLEENRKTDKPLFVPSWAVLRVMGQKLVRSRTMVQILANRVGGGISIDQIYSYFSLRRRKPDGEFALRFLRLVELFRGLNTHSTAGPAIRMEKDWYFVQQALDIELRAALKRSKRTGLRLYQRQKLPKVKRPHTSSSLLKSWTKLPRSV